jgi:hypothetical protein
VAAVILGLAAPGPGVAQVPSGTPASASTPVPRLPAAELEKLVGPIALYPDALVAIVLPSATTPIDIVKAQRFLDKHNQDPKLKPDPSLPEPVRNLLNYPEVVKMMSDDIDWTEKLGQAVVAQQKDVMQAIQTFRRKAQVAGNLKSNDKQIVVVEKEVIEIIPANPQVIYVPQYQPSTVVVYQSTPAVVYYPTAYPVYYYPYPPGTTFATGFFAGAATAYAVGWANNSLYYGMNYDDAQQLQQNRMNYASQSREDWQSWSSQQQSQRQQATQDRQTQRQDSVSGAQDQRAQTQSQRQESASQAQSQRQQGAGQAQAQQTQAQRQGGQASGQSWQPSQQGGQAQASAQSSQFGGRQSGGEGGAFGGRGSGAETSQMSQRGA